MSARRTVPDLGVRSSIGHMLPALFHDDELAQRWCSGLDAVVAPVPTTIDNFAAYLDARLAPLDFVEWLSTWVGLELDQTWTEPRRRELVASSYRLHDARGTARGLADLIELYTGTRPEIDDGAGVRWSSTPDAELPGSDEPELVVRLRVADPDAVDADRLETMVRLSKPAHIRHRIEIEHDPTGTAQSPSPPPPPPPPAPSSSSSPSPVADNTSQTGPAPVPPTVAAGETEDTPEPDELRSTTEGPRGDGPEADAAGDPPDDGS